VSTDTAPSKAQIKSDAPRLDLGFVEMWLAKGVVLGDRGVEVHEPANVN
jgi:hypothetical protein